MATTYDKASLVMIPSGYKDDKLYSIKPTDGSGDFTFSRDGAGASPATRVNASGLIEKGRTNELTYSNDFSNWTSANTTETSGQSGYDGTNDAWLLSKAASAGNIQLSVSTSGVNTFSYYAKAGTLNWTRLLILGSTNASTYINLSDGSIGVGGGGFIDATATSVGGGWYRVSITHSTAITQVRIYPADADDDTSGTSGNIYIHAQLEQGLVATAPAIETTTAPVSAGLLGDMPRLDYSGGATCGSLLLEPSRVNLVQQSEYIASSYWSTLNAAFDANTTISPEGNQNAFKLKGSVGVSDQVYIGVSLALASAGTYTYSFFAKADDKNFIRLRTLGFDASANTATWFDLSNGTIGTDQSGNAKIESYGNGWYRCSYSFTTTTDLVGSIYAYLGDSDGGFAVSRDGTGVFLYGAQLELGSYPTSYIPTYGSASTRAKDAPSLTSVSDLIGQEEGTFFIEWDNIGDTSRPYLALSAGGSTANRVLVYESGGVNAQIKSGGSVVFQSTTASVSGTIKAAVAYKTNDFVFYVNGTQYGTDSSGATFSGTTLNEVEFDHANLVGASMKQCVVFKTRLTNAELAALTA